MTIEPHSMAPGSPGDGQPQSLAEDRHQPPGGCSRPLLIGCAVVVMLLGLGLLVFLWKAGELMPAALRWSLDQFEQQVAGSLPEDLSEAERQRLADAFAAAAAAVEDGTADVAALQRLQSELLGLARGGSLTREDVLELTEALEGVAGDGVPLRQSPEPPPETGERAMPKASRRSPSRHTPDLYRRLPAA